MPYFTDPQEIQAVIAKCAQARILWLDTEVADYQTSKPKLSLIQVLDNYSHPEENYRSGRPSYPKTEAVAGTQISALLCSADQVSILDVLHQPKLVDEFIETIMVNPAIEKVFHNASYDVRFLGKGKTQNITCTLEMAKKLPYSLVPLPNHKLQTLVEKLCNLPPVDKTEQESDWGKRPLKTNQLNYAKMDPVYVAQVHQRLLELIEPDPAQEDIEALILRYRQIEERWKQLDAEVTYIKNRIKAAMKTQKVSKQAGFNLSSSQRTTKKVPFKQLANLTQSLEIELDLPVTLTKELQQKLGEAVEELPIQEEVSTYWRLSIKDQDDNDLPF
ncbi:MAG: ribonuclease D [Symploca sp. SIO1C2]|nr:ribonuclease D [Symploca sp. SIO1C2]